MCLNNPDFLARGIIKLVIFSNDLIKGNYFVLQKIFVSVSDLCIRDLSRGGGEYQSQ